MIPERKIKTLQDLHKAALFSNTHFGGGQTWFRGQRGSGRKWELRPKLFRKFRSHDTEVLMTNKFRLQAPTRVVATPDFEDLAGWLCLMQHHGLPTRLLDWTSSVLVAALFAVEEFAQCRRDACIWALSPAALNAKWIGRDAVFWLSEPELRELLQPAFGQDEPKCEKVAAALPREVDLRMTMQRAALTIHGTGRPLEELLESEEALVRLVIPEQHVKDLYCQLHNVGITRGYLFPDLQNLAADLELEGRMEEIS